MRISYITVSLIVLAVLAQQSLGGNVGTEGICRNVDCPNGYECRNINNIAQCVNVSKGQPPIKECSQVVCPLGFSCRVKDNGQVECYNTATGQSTTGGHSSGSSSSSGHSSSSGWTSGKPTSCDTLKCPPGYQCQQQGKEVECVRVPPPTNPPTNPPGNKCDSVRCPDGYHCESKGDAATCVPNGPKKCRSDRDCGWDEYCDDIPWSRIGGDDDDHIPWTEIGDDKQPWTEIGHAYAEEGAEGWNRPRYGICKKRPTKPPVKKCKSDSDCEYNEYCDKNIQRYSSSSNSDDDHIPWSEIGHAYAEDFEDFEEGRRPIRWGVCRKKKPTPPPVKKCRFDRDCGFNQYCDMDEIPWTTITRSSGRSSSSSDDDIPWTPIGRSSGRSSSSSDDDQPWTPIGNTYAEEDAEGWGHHRRWGVCKDKPTPPKGSCWSDRDCGRNQYCWIPRHSGSDRSSSSSSDDDIPWTPIGRSSGRSSSSSDDDQPWTPIGNTYAEDIEENEQGRRGRWHRPPPGICKNKPTRPPEHRCKYDKDCPSNQFCFKRVSTNGNSIRLEDPEWNIFAEDFDYADIQPAEIQPASPPKGGSSGGSSGSNSDRHHHHVSWGVCRDKPYVQKCNKSRDCPYDQFCYHVGGHDWSESDCSSSDSSSSSSDSDDDNGNRDHMKWKTISNSGVCKKKPTKCDLFNCPLGFYCREDGPWAKCVPIPRPSKRCYSDRDCYGGHCIFRQNNDLSNNEQGWSDSSSSDSDSDWDHHRHHHHHRRHGMCVYPPTPSGCQSDMDCPFGTQCQKIQPMGGMQGIEFNGGGVQGVCVPKKPTILKCQDYTDCPINQVCLQNHTCSIRFCNVSLLGNCPPGHYCAEGFCHESALNLTCTVDTQCPPKYYCNKQTNKCSRRVVPATSIQPPERLPYRPPVCNKDCGNEYFCARVDGIDTCVRYPTAPTSQPNRPDKCDTLLCPIGYKCKNLSEDMVACVDNQGRNFPGSVQMI
ncbi:spore coat protein SP70 [Tieghemostelium lacteum]|uniref:Spore coat protein SP70 n=1 Tax=Tieghemostelium lacteum TaxID=361077 RepID=A0A151ZHC2_TIELA|nr:spore coat protein SP70 [Tieghemostelium lacteum]|eukprot:KYQ93388.1 spore coat protein SP70 [Tieghemostelium lacteum]